MERCSRTSAHLPRAHGIGGLLAALACAAALSGCGDKITNEIPTPTRGSLNVNITPASASVTVTGPAAFTQTFTGNHLVVDLEPGEYTVAGTATGYIAASAAINVVAGYTTGISLILQQTFSSVTVGQLNVNVTPASASVTVTGPAAFTQTFTGNYYLVGLAPGTYSVRATAPGFVTAAGQINVVVGQTSSISLPLVAERIIVEAPRAVYRDGAGNLVPLDAAALQSGEFVFYAWLRDLPLGIVPDTLVNGAGDPGKPLAGEQIETAPSFTQDLAVAWVGFMDATGVVRPVIGADVRWEIDQWWGGRLNSMQFGTSDDNRLALSYGVSDDQADTRTNNENLDAERFPLVATEFPLFNQTGIGTPYVDGLTWVTLFSPDKIAAGRIVAVATIDGEEIGKQILFKSFAPAPELVIAKTVSDDVVHLVAGSATVTWNVTVRNIGLGDATNVDLTDFLASQNGASYTLGTLPPGVTPEPATDGFHYVFPLASVFTPAADQNAQPLGVAQSFAVLANSTVTNTGTTLVSGNVGVSAGSAVTGLLPADVTNGTIHNNDAIALAAQPAVAAAQTALGARACGPAPVNTSLTGTLTPGVYCYDSSAAVAGPLVLDGQGDPGAEFIFKIASTLTTPSAASITLVNGASPCNVYWLVGSSATFGTNTTFAGNIIAQASISVGTGSTISGRALAHTGGVTLDSNAVSAPLTCVPTPDSTKSLTFTATVTAPGTYCNEVRINSYDDSTQTLNPVDLGDQACFTALESKVSIVKDFVAFDDSTSLGDAQTVAINQPARLRVRVLNVAGGGDATDVAVMDLLDGGASAAYQIAAIPAGTTPEAADGFSITYPTIADGAEETLFYTVSASADGTYCDTATIDSVGSGIIGIGTDTACLTVATPVLTISKTDAPASVLPGGTYTSTIVVENVGHATARNVAIRDLIGLNAAANVRAIYVSSSLGGAGGTLTNNAVTSNSVDVQAGETITFTVVSRIPLGAASGTYCDTASVTSSNAASPASVDDCVDVPAFSALQTQLVDLADPVAAGSDVTYFSVLYVEALSNEGVSQNQLTYSFGLPSPTTLEIPGDFRIVSTFVYLDTRPVRDPTTGLVVSDASNGTATLLTEGIDYTADDGTPGLQLLDMTASVALQPDTALYVVHVVSVPATVTPNHMYTTGYVWRSHGMVVPAHTYQASSSEPTTVLP